MTYRLLLGIVLCAAAATSLSAQDANEPQDSLGWSHEFGLGLNITQSKYSNWVAGGEDTFAWQFSLMNADTLFQSTYDWANTLQFDFGQTQIGSADARKNVDELVFESIFTYKVNIYVNPYVSFKLRTQVADGFQYEDTETGTVRTKVSGLFDPAYLTQAFGVGYTPYKDVNTRLGLAVKQTIANDFAALYSDDPETPDEIETSRVEVGMQSVSTAKLPLSNTIAYKGRLELFTDFASVEDVDVNFDNIIEGKLNEIISVNLNVRLQYDNDVSSKRQLAQILSVGFSYIFW